MKQIFSKKSLFFLLLILISIGFFLNKKENIFLIPEKLGLGIENPAWTLDVAHTFVPESGTGGLTPQLSHYNAARIQQTIKVDKELFNADTESLYGVTNYIANASTSQSYLVGIHGDVYVTGPGNIGPQMIVGLWGTANYDGTGNDINMLMGLRGEITVNSGSGVDLASIYAAKPELNGGETENAFGLYIEDMAGMGINRAKYPWAIYSEGKNPSYFGGSIGLGTVMPLATLDVRSTSGIRLGGTATKYINLFTTGGGNDINTAGGDLFLEYDKTNAVDILNGSLRVNTDGKVGLGTVSPSAALDITSSLGIRIGSSSKFLTIYTSGGGNDINTGGGDLFLEYDKTNAVDILNGSLRVNTDGKVGLGTASPSVALDITSSTGVRIGSSTKSLTFYTSGAGNDIKSLGGTLFLNYDRLQTVDIQNGQAYFGTDGNVGIGTTSPLAKLDVSGTASVSGNFYLGNSLRSSNSPLSFDYKADVNTWATAMFIANTGYVGIGTTSPNNPLTVNNVAGIRSGTDIKYIDIYTSGGGNDINSSHTLHLNYGNNQAVSIGEGGTSNLYVSGNTGIGTLIPGSYKLYVNGSLAVNSDTADKTGSTSWGTLSDVRLKDLQGNYVLGLNEIMQLNPIKFNYKAGNPLGVDFTKTYIGFSAQDVQKIIPEAVSLRPDGYLRLNSDPIMWAMLNAIKEQQTEITSQSAVLKSQSEQKDIVDLIKKTISEAITVFKNTVTYLADVIFEGRVIFKDKDLAGYAIIKQNAKEVKIIYEKPYETEPIVNVTAKKENISFAVTNESKDGFTIKLNSTASEDLYFSWIAILVKDAKTYESSDSVVSSPESVMPTSTPVVEPTITQNQIPTIEPPTLEASPTPATQSGNIPTILE
jgi:hypothetical protein